MGEIDFLIVGAAKSATTWLQRCLQADPAVYMPDPELHYFSREYHRGADWYLSQFTPGGGARMIGEKSNSYLDTPAAIDRIARDVPHAKFIAQLRNPVDRAYSDYCMFYRRGQVGKDIGRYLNPRSADETRILPAGLYSQQLAAFYRRFPSERMLITFYENISSEPAAQLEKVRHHLGLPPVAGEGFVQAKVKDKTAPMVSPALRRILGPIKPLIAPFRKTASFRRMHAALSSEVQYAPFTDELRQRLTDYYAADVEILGGMIGRDLHGWLGGKGVPAETRIPVPPRRQAPPLSSFA
jgi:hypothetical protein